LHGRRSAAAHALTAPHNGRLLLSEVPAPCFRSVNQSFGILMDPGGEDLGTRELLCLATGLELTPDFFQR